MRFVLLTVLLLTGCVSVEQATTPEIAEAIPDGANVIQVHSDTDAPDFYRAIYQQLAQRGFAMDESNDEMLTFATEFNEIGQETLLKVRGFVAETDGGSVATLRGRWGAGQQMAMFATMMAGASSEQLQGQPAAWKPRDRGGVAFGALATLAAELPHTQIEYVVE